MYIDGYIFTINTALFVIPMIVLTMYNSYSISLQVSGLAPPKPVCSFAHFGFDQSLLEAIRKSGYSQPTPIQSQVCYLHHRNIYFLLWPSPFVKMTFLCSLTK